jgi:hypothetical protein
LSARVAPLDQSTEKFGNARDTRFGFTTRPIRKLTTLMITAP